METKNITKAILEVMKEIKGIEKDSNVGSGSYGYKGVKDQDVKQIVRKAMQAHGLAIIPTSVEEETKMSEWDDQGKHKQSTFTKVKTKYLLLHESGESLEIAGYGHGVDNQDKGAGKATTYALKYALLYMFMIPTGDIDDTEDTHSNDIETKPINKPLPSPMGEGKMCPTHHVETNRFGGHELSPGKWCSDAQRKNVVGTTEPK